jgi:tetratricopeptide (TPR) repeat protein
VAAAGFSAIMGGAMGPRETARGDGPAGGAPGTRSRAPLIFAVAVFVAIAAGAGALFLGKGPRDASGPALPPPSPAPAPPADFRVIWTDVTAAAGIRFRHEAGARGEVLNPETFGSGCGWLDFDGDGLIDLLFVNSNLLRGDLDPKATPALYRNLGGGRFEDATERAGLAIPIYGMGLVSADVEGDGDQDLFLYGLQRSLFFLNDGPGRFREATAAAGLANLPGWICAAAFLDYDRDGRLDLYVGNYVTWTADREKEVDCTFGTARKKYCPVAVFDPSAPQLFRGRGDGTFDERTREAGLAGLKGKTLGVAVEDHDRDGFPDIFVANDSVPNFLLRNRGDGTFEDRGLESGFATDGEGAALAGMGIDTAWAPDGGPLYVCVGNFSGEPATFHVEEAPGFFVEKSLAWGIGRSTMNRVTFGLHIYDEDLDGNFDILLVNGHVFDVEDITGVPYRQTAQLFLGRDWKSYDEARVTEPAHFLNRPVIGRSAALADYDGDGDIDLAVTENQGPAVLLRNDLPGPRSFVRIDLRGTRSNRDALGAEVTLRAGSAGGARSVRRTRKAVSGYLSQSERVLTFGLRPGEDRCDVEVLWPSGLRESFPSVPPGRQSLLVEGTGGKAVEIAAAPAPGADPGARSRPAAGPNPILLRRRGIELLRMGRFAEASVTLAEAVRIDPTDFAAQRFALVALFRSGRKKEVGEKVAEIARVFPDPHFLVSHFALVLRETKEVELSEMLFREAIRLDPRRVDVWIALGNIAFDRKDLDEADRSYHRVLVLKPDSIEAMANVGKILVLRKDYGAARPWLEGALALRPDYATALSTLAGVHIQEGRLDIAEEGLLRARDLPCSKDTLLTIHGNLGILYMKKRDRRQAVECFRKVLEIEPGDPQARAVLERLGASP